MLSKIGIRKITVTSAALFVIGLIYLFPTKDLKIEKNINYIDEEKLSQIYMLDNNNYVSEVLHEINADTLIDKLRCKLESITNSEENKIKNFKGLIPANTKVLSIDVKDKVCTVDFSKELLGVSALVEEKMIEAIVFTLTSESEVTSVIIKVDGKVLERLPNSNKLLPNILDRSYGINKKIKVGGILNERKINYKISGNAFADVNEVVEINAVSSIDDLSENQQKLTTIKTTKNICSKTEKINIKEEVAIPPTKLPIDEIISIEPTLLNTEAVPSQDSVKISGDITASMLYTSNESSVPEVFDIDIPFDGMIETEDVEPNMEINTDLTITDFYYDVSEDENGENRIVNLEFVINACIEAYATQENEILEDAYSVNNNITMENETLCYDREVCRNKSQCPVKDIVSIDNDCPAMLQIIKAVGTPYIDVISIFDNKVVIDGVINVSILYVTGDDTMPVYCANGAVPFSQTVEARGAEEGMKADVDCVLSHIGFNMISDREVEVRCALNTNTIVTEKICAVLATDVNIEPMDRAVIDGIAAFIIYTVQKGDTLWKLAKRFNTTVEDILAVNDIENPDLIYPGQRLIIVKHID